MVDNYNKAVKLFMLYCPFPPPPRYTHLPGTLPPPLSSTHSNSPIAVCIRLTLLPPQPFPVECIGIEFSIANRVPLDFELCVPLQILLVNDNAHAKRMINYLLELATGERTTEKSKCPAAGFKSTISVTLEALPLSSLMSS